MSIYCADCSYRGKKSGQGGRCPACGSPTLRREGSDADTASAGNGKWRLLLLGLLWALLTVLIAQKLWP